MNHQRSLAVGVTVVLGCAGVEAATAAPGSQQVGAVPSRLVGAPTVDVWDAVTLGAPLPKEGDQGWFVRRAVAQEFQAAPGGDIVTSAGYWDGSTLHYGSGEWHFVRDRADNVMTVPGRTEGEALQSVPVDPGLLAPRSVTALASYARNGTVVLADEQSDSIVPSLGGLTTENLEGIGALGECSADYVTKIAKFGKVELCWRKYRAVEDDPSVDYWVYYSNAMAKPHDRSFPRIKAYVANVQSGSRMGAAYANTLGVKGIESHWPRSDLNPSGCIDHEMSVGVADESPKPLLKENVSVCENVTIRKDEGVGYFAADMRIDTGRWSNHEKDRSLVHAAITATASQPYPEYQDRVEWTDFHSGRFCVTMFNCGSTG